MFARNDARGKRVETDTMRALAGAAAYTDGPRRNAEYNPAHFTLLDPHLRISLYFEKARRLIWRTVKLDFTWNIDFALAGADGPG